MSAKLTKGAIDSLGHYFITCEMYVAAKKIREANVGDFLEDILTPEEFSGVVALSSDCEQVGALDVHTHFGGRNHYDKVSALTTSGKWLLDGAPELLPLFHLALPIEDSVYKNEFLEVGLKGLVRLGESNGNDIAHLGFVFSSHCSAKDLNKILRIQRTEVPEALELLLRRGSFDFGRYQDHQQKVLERMDILGL